MAAKKDKPTTAAAAPALDWGQPIQFENGEPCELIDTLTDDNCGVFSDTRRVIRRVGVDGLSAIWYMPEDGSSPFDGYNVINVPTAPASEAAN